MYVFPNQACKSCDTSSHLPMEMSLDISLIPPVQAYVCVVLYGHMTDRRSSTLARSWLRSLDGMEHGALSISNL